MTSSSPKHLRPGVQGGDVADADRDLVDAQRRIARTQQRSQDDAGDAADLLTQLAQVRTIGADDLHRGGAATSLTRLGSGTVFFTTSATPGDHVGPCDVPNAATAHGHGRICTLGERSRCWTSGCPPRKLRDDVCSSPPVGA